MVGQKNVSNLQLTDFNKEFGVEALFNKLVNLGDDISGSKLVDSDVFKKQLAATGLTWIVSTNRHWCLDPLPRLYSRLTQIQKSLIKLGPCKDVCVW